MFFPTLTVYAIMKDELHNLEDFLEQFSQANHVVLLDTGSEDGTYERAKEIAETDKRLIVERAIIDPFNFSTARNMAMNIAHGVAQDKTVFMWADLDERFEPDWYTKLVSWFEDEMPSFSKPWALFTVMDFNVAENGQVLMAYNQRKIHSAQGHKWNYACHEIIVSEDDCEFFQSDIHVKHLTDPEKARDYFDILEAEYHERPHDLRSLYYYGRELYYRGEYKKAVELLGQGSACTEMVTSAQLIEAYILGGDAAAQLGQYSTAEHFYMCALSINPECCLAMYYLARDCYNTNNVAGQIYWANKAIPLLPKAHINVIYNRTAEIAWQLYDYVALGYDACDQKEDALQLYAVMMQQWQKHIPKTELQRIQENVQYLVSKVQARNPQSA